MHTLHPDDFTCEACHSNQKGLSGIRIYSVNSALVPCVWPLLVWRRVASFTGPVNQKMSIAVMDWGAAGVL